VNSVFPASAVVILPFVLVRVTVPVLWLLSVLPSVKVRIPKAAVWLSAAELVKLEICMLLPSLVVKVITDLLLGSANEAVILVADVEPLIADARVVKSLVAPTTALILASFNVKATVPAADNDQK
jgi:hypothetical protein